jgi:hypothetical protein
MFMEATYTPIFQGRAALHPKNIMAENDPAMTHREGDCR